MPVNLVRGAVLALAMSLLVGCTDASTVNAPADTPDTLGSVEASLVDTESGAPATTDPISLASISMCGTVCPAGFHPTSFGFNSSCGGSPTTRNSVSCDPNQGDQFGTCGTVCPAGYHPTGFGFNSSCGGSPVTNNSAGCGINAGVQFSSCGTVCPTGYYPTGIGYDFSCGGSPVTNNSVGCHRLLDGHVTASPWSIALAPGQTGTTTVAWTTQSASTAEVRALAPGQGERVIATGLSGSTTYGPIAAGETHTLRLYGNGTLLETATVSAYALTGTITASPQLVIVNGGTGSTTIAWSSQGVGANAGVYVSMDGAVASKFAGGASGSAVAPWIQGGHSYRFSLRINTATSPELAAVVVTGQAQTPPAIDPVAGPWWNPSRSGNGFDLRVSGDTLVMYWLTYDGGGSPIWYAANLAREPGRWRGDLAYVTWNGSYPSIATVGAATITLSSSDHGQITWTLNGATGSEPIEHMVFGGGAGSPSLSGLWYAPAESGWGLNFDTQGSTHVGYLLAYTAGGAPTWVMGVASGGGPVIAFDLTRVTGVNLCPGCTGTTSTSSAAAGFMSITTDRLGSGRATATVDAALAGGTWSRPSVELARLLP